jgi:hypothetical protein
VINRKEPEPQFVISAPALGEYLIWVYGSRPQLHNTAKYTVKVFILLVKFYLLEKYEVASSILV